MRLVILSVCFLSAFAAPSQNLVPNASFEEYVVCPGSYSQGKAPHTIPGWSSPNGGTPDQFNSCGSGDANVPYNWAGVADAYDGNGYAGIYLWMQVKPYREFLQCKLTQPLIKDSVYTVSFRYKLSSYSKYAIDRIGLSFGKQAATYKSDEITVPENVLAVIQDSALTKRTGLWEHAAFKYKATGDEQFLVIGNFWIATNSYEIKTRPVSEPMLATASYYYIDDVQVILPSTLPKVQVNEVDFASVEANKNYVLRNIQFAHDSYRLLEPSFEELDRLAQYLLKFQDVNIQLFGHTDDVGGDKYNLRLSQQRAKNVADYLATFGIARSRIETYGYGKSRPLINDRSNEARRLNRRVEIRFLR